MKLPRYRPAVGITFLALCILADVTLLFLIGRWHPFRGWLTYLGFALVIVWTVFGR